MIFINSYKEKLRTFDKKEMKKLKIRKPSRIKTIGFGYGFYNSNRYKNFLKDDLRKYLKDRKKYWEQSTKTKNKRLSIEKLK